MTTSRYFLILLILLASTLFAQTRKKNIDKKFIVGDIKIFGNETTEDYIILDELPFSVGDTITYKDLDYAKERVYSLKLFSFIDFVTDNKNPKRIIILVKESWYIFPIPFIVFRKNSMKYSNYGINFLWKNFRGRNETINAVLSLGFDPIFKASYFNPNFIKRNLRFGFGGGIVSVLNKSLFFENEIAKEEFSSRSFFVTSSIGSRLSLNETLDLNIAYRYYYLNKSYANQYFGSRKNNEYSISLSLAYKYDSRNLSFNPTNGSYFSTSLGYNYYPQVVTENKFSGLALLSAEYRTFRTIAKTLILRGKIKANLTPYKNYLPYYDKFYFGYTNYIRGHSNDKTEGNNYFLASAEIALPIFSNKRISFDLPVMPAALTSFRFETQLVFFFDAGKTFDTFEKWKIPYGFGAGVYLFFMPFDVVRFEFAFNENLNWEFLIGTGFPF